MRNACPPTVWSPHYSIHESADHYVLVFELAGLTLADVSLTMKGYQVRLSGNRPSPDGTEMRHVVSDIYCGPFETVIGLPRTVKGDQAEVQFEKGLLRLTLPFDPKEPEVPFAEATSIPPWARDAAWRERECGGKIDRLSTEL